METSPSRQDPFQKLLRSRDGTLVFDNCQQIWFEFLRTRVDEVRRTRTENPYVFHLAIEDSRCVHPLTHFLCPYDPVPLTQSRQEHVHRARRTRKGLFCIYVGDVRRHVGGFQPYEPTQVHERMTRKCDIWAHLTPLHTAHTHHNASVSQNNTPTVLCCRWRKRLL